MNKVIVIGGGASGMMAAITAATQGSEVLILEHGEQLGKKILSTGNGRCNFTNITQNEACYRSSNPTFPRDALKEFDVMKTISYFLSLGIYSKNQNGYLYPYSEQAISVANALIYKVDELGISVKLQEKILGIHSTNHPSNHSTNHRFQIQTQSGKYEADKVILACGSKASALKESDGSGYELAKMLGHRIILVTPALVQLKSKEAIFKKLAGIRIHGKVSLYGDEKLLAEDIGQIQLTKYGISGIPVFQVSRYAAKALENGAEVVAYLDFMPEFTKEQLEAFLNKRIQQQHKHTMEQFFNGLLPTGLGNAIIYCLHKKNTDSVSLLTKKDLANLLLLLKEFRTTIIGTNGFEQAQICAGGVDTLEVDSQTMESKLVSGLYFCGEILDVDGICGGYNLQWAWSSGYVAGREAANASY